MARFRWLVTLVVFAAALLAGCGGGGAAASVNTNPGTTNVPPPPPAPTGWTSHGLTIPAAHPRIWWNSTLLAQAKSWAAKNPSALPASLPSSPVARDFINLAWEHVVNGTDCTPAITWAANTNQSAPVAGWPPPAGETSTQANGSDTMRGEGEAAIVVYDWCNDQWSAAQKSAFISSMNTWLGNIDAQSWGGPSTPESNYAISNMRDDIEWGIATYGDNGSGTGSVADGFLDAGLNTRWAKMKTQFASNNGGVPEEGPEYGSWMNTLTFLLQTTALEGRDLTTELPRFKADAFYMIYGTTPAPTFDPVDNVTAFQLFSYEDEEHYPSDGGMYFARNYWADIANWESNFWQNTGNVGKYARLFYNTIIADANTQPPDLYYLSQDTNPPAMADYSALPLDYFDNSTQYSFSRAAWDTTSAALFLQMGQGADGNGHGHFDYGNFTLWRGGRFVDRESAGYDNVLAGTPGLFSDANVISSSPLAHNVMVFTNVPIGVSSSTKASGMMPTVAAGTPTIERMETQPAYFYEDVDLTPVYQWSSDYPQNNTGVVGHVEREVLFIRPLETLVVLDRVLTGNESASYGSLLAPAVVTTFVSHCEMNPTVEDSNHFTCTDGPQVARQSVLLPASATYRVINENSCTGCSNNGQYRIEVDNSGAAQRYDLDVIQTRAATSANLTASVVDSNPSDPTSGTFTVTLQPATGAPTTIVFNKGETSSGGSINVGGAGVVNLRADVQTMSYNDNGPVWGK